MLKRLSPKTISTIILTSLLFSITAFIPLTHAEDCLHDPIYEQDWNAEVTTGVRVRDIPCMETSVVLTTLGVGTVVKVIAETDGYYKISMQDGTEGWVGQWLIGPTDKPFNGTSTPTEPEEPKDPLYDIVGHKFETAVRWMDENEIISGYPDGSFQPDGTINRAEMVKIMSLTYSKANPTFKFADVKNQYNKACFKDISTNQWYTEYVCYAKEIGIIEGYPDGEFRPANSISKVEALKIILGSLDMTVEQKAMKNYFDDTDINEWYAPYIEAAYFNNLLEETSGNFHPGNDILRGESANIIYLAYMILEAAINNEPTI